LSNDYILFHSARVSEYQQTFFIHLFVLSLVADIHDLVMDSRWYNTLRIVGECGGHCFIHYLVTSYHGLV